jgi:site-specific DNA recombinase
MKTTPKYRTAAIYARVSTDDQAKEGHSLEAQVDRCSKCAEGLGLEVVKVFQDDGYSGGTMNRPGLRQLLDTVVRRGVDVVVIAEDSRLSRDEADAHFIRKTMRRSGVRLVFTTAPTLQELTDTDQLKEAMEIAFSAHQRRLIGARTREVMAHLRAQGRRISGYAPAGKRFNEDGMVVDDWAGQEALSMALELRRGGASYRRIAIELNQAGFRTKSGGLHHAMSVGRMFSSTMAKTMAGGD